MNVSAPIFYIIFAVLLGCPAAAAPNAGDVQKNPLKDISGFWYTQDREGGIELYPCGGEVCGRFYWLNDDGGPTHISLDSRNPDPDLRKRPLCHAQFVGGFVPDGKDHYKDGWIYSPRHGATFSAEMTLLDRNTLDLHGYIFIPALGESQTWTRAKSLPSCVGG